MFVDKIGVDALEHDESELGIVLLVGAVGAVGAVIRAQILLVAIVDDRSLDELAKDEPVTRFQKRKAKMHVW